MTSNPFKRFYTTVVSIVQYKINDYTGEKETKVLGTLKADIQPYSGDKAREAYGIEIECQKRMFCEPDPNIDVRNYLEINGEIYEIVHVAEWNMGLEVMLQRSRLK